MKHIYKLIYLALPLLLSSCIKEGFDKDNCPGSIVIMPIAPPELGPSTELKNSYTKIIDANGKEMEIKAGSDKPLDLEDGDYTIVSTKALKEGQTEVKGTTISVTTLPDGTAGDPGTSVGGYTNITVGAQAGTGQDEVKIEIPTKHQSRPLIIKLHFEGENTTFVQSITGLVSGIALSRDLNHGFAPVDGTDRHPATTTGLINYSFAQDAEAVNSYQGQCTLLGICGNSTQNFSMTITYKGDVQKAYSFDITRQLDGFHTIDVTSPWVIEITLRLGADFEATIEDWKVGPESWMDAH